MVKFGEKVKSAKYTRQHFVEIAGLLKQTKADKSLVDAYVNKFKADNPRFNEALFRQASKWD